MKITRILKQNTRYLFLLTLFIGTSFAQDHTFSTFNTGTITGGAAEVTQTLNVTGLTHNYIFIVVTADFVGGADPAWSQTIQMELDNGGSTIYRTYSGATAGALASSNLTTLIWSDLLQQTYAGGTSLRIKFKDTFDDELGTYTSELQNVTVTIYVTPTPVKSFAAFNTGTITGGAAPVDEFLDVSGLTFDYLFYVVSADFVGGADPAWSQTIQMQLDNNGSTNYKTFGNATTGALASSNSTTLIWTGVMERVYAGGGALRVRFRDTFDDESGTYTSQLNNVSVKIFPAPIPTKEFNSYNTGTITGGGAEVIQSLDVTGLTDDYLFYIVSADFVGGADPAWSQTIQMELDNGGSTIYRTYSGATAGALASSNSTTLIWSGLLQQTYAGGTSLRIKFKDTFDDELGTYTSELQNVTVTIYSKPSTTPLPVELVAFKGYNTESGVVLNWETATETNNYGFQVQRTKDKDQSEWEDIGFVQGHGTTNSPKNYEFADSELPNFDEVSYRLKQIDNDGKFTYSKTITVDLTTLTSIDDDLKYEFSLEQNYPNPFNPSTTIRFTIPNVGNAYYASQHTKLVIYNSLGQEVVTLANEEKPPGNYEVTFDAESLSSGIYFYKLTSGNLTQTKKLILIR